MRLSLTSSMANENAQHRPGYEVGEDQRHGDLIDSFHGAGAEVYGRFLEGDAGLLEAGVGRAYHIG